MNMKRTAIYVLAGFAAIFLASSCIKLGGEMEYTPEREYSLLNNYIAELTKRGHNVDTTELGVFYVTLEQGTGVYPQPGDTLSVQYNGYLISGGMFDSSVYHSSDSLYVFIYKSIAMIEGWDDIMKVMNKGKKMEFIIPSSLAYGKDGYPGVIPPYTSLIYVAKMHNIRPGQD